MRRRDRFRAGLDQQRAAPAEQPDGVGLVDERQRIGGDGVAAHLDELKGIVAVVDAAGDKPQRALARQPGVGAMQQKQEDGRRRRVDESLGVALFDRGHVAPVVSAPIKPRC